MRFIFYDYMLSIAYLYCLHKTVLACPPCNAGVFFNAFLRFHLMLDAFAPTLFDSIEAFGICVKLALTV